MLDLKCSLFVEATKDPNMFGFYSPDLEGFTGIGHSIQIVVEAYLNRAQYTVKQ